MNKQVFQCYHCGADCNDAITVEEKVFCCEGCKMVFQLLDENGMCNYYDLSDMPGVQAKGVFASDKYNYLDSTAIQDQLISFRSKEQAHVSFYLPQIHCVSCIWLLEHLNKINSGIIHSTTNFEKKEIKIVFKPEQISLKELVQLLAFVGYEPMIHLGGNDWLRKKKVNKKQLFKIGIAGFCFSNIMMLSFPEYLAGEATDLGNLRQVFTYLNLVLSLPVLLYSAKDFFVSAYTGIRQKWLNIDAPIALAIVVTFGRSLYEILTHTGAGYLDSMSGIVFFMLVGRWFQDKSYDSFSFERDYTSFFPLGVTVITADGTLNKPLNELKKGERVLVRSEEMIPADAIVLTEGALMDYSFVSGENAPIEIPKTSLVYAGGIQKGKSIEVEVVKTLGHSYITELWNNPLLGNKKNEVKSFVHPWSQKFTIALFIIAISAGLYWWINDTNKILPAVTSVLIVACPCSLLLTVTFTYGNVLRYLGKSKMYCKNASVIESMDKIDTIVFDKTGTLTNHHDANLEFIAIQEGLTAFEIDLIYAVTRESLHPLSQLIMRFLQSQKQSMLKVDSIEHYPGKGTKAICGSSLILVGSIKLMQENNIQLMDESSGVHIAINGVHKGHFQIQHQYRAGIASMVKAMQKAGFALHLLSGDHPTEKMVLQQMFGEDVPMHFEQNPDDKLKYIQVLQSNGKHVMMVGDGLNDAGALQKADLGIAVTDQSHLFTPASDAIIEGEQLPYLHQLLQYGKKAKGIIIFIFIVSILYNVIGMFFATQALLSPMVAAILMPISSISIVALSAFLSYWFSRKI